MTTPAESLAGKHALALGRFQQVTKVTSATGRICPIISSIFPIADRPMKKADSMENTPASQNPAPSPAVLVSDLVKRYKEKVALDHFDLEIRRGEIFGLLGPNGSGKTTAINCILQLLTYDNGEVLLFGEPMTPTSYGIKRRIGVVPQNVAVFEELTVRENIDYFCSLYVADRESRRRMVDKAIGFVGLEGYEKYRPKKLSGGLARRLNIACGIAHGPELIFMDEPTVAVDPQSRNSILEGIKRLNREGATVVYTSHYMEEVEEICTRIMIMDAGRGIATGTAEELKLMVEPDPEAAALLTLNDVFLSITGTNLRD